MRSTGFYSEQFDLISSPVSRFCTGAKSGVIDINIREDCGRTCVYWLNLISSRHLKPLESVSSVPLATKYKIKKNGTRWPKEGCFMSFGWTCLNKDRNRVFFHRVEKTARDGNTSWASSDKSPSPLLL